MTVSTISKTAAPWRRWRPSRRRRSCYGLSTARKSFTKCSGTICERNAAGGHGPPRAGKAPEVRRPLSPGCHAEAKRHGTEVVLALRGEDQMDLRQGRGEVTQEGP